MSAGYIYILSNPAMPGLLKIGFTNGDVKKRVRQLSAATGVPKPFEIEYYILTRDVEEIEREVHKQFSSKRERGKEFFSVPVVEVVGVIKLLVKEVIPDCFSRVTEQGAPGQEEKLYHRDGVKRWQKKEERGWVWMEK